MSSCSDCGATPTTSDSLSPAPPQSDTSSPTSSSSSSQLLFCALCFELKFGHRRQQQTGGMWTWCTFRQHFLPPDFDVVKFDMAQRELSMAEGLPDQQRKKRPICIINTGGTISCMEDADAHTLSPSPMFEYLSSNIPAFKGGKLVQEKDYKEDDESNPPDFVILESSHLMIDSTNATYNDWNLLALLCTTRQLRFSSIVIMHGTDSMAFTAAALSFSMWGLCVPVIITGSQVPLRTHYGCGDGLSNLMGALEFARFAADRRVIGVFIYFATKILLGHRATKLHTSNFDAFDAPSTGVCGFYSGVFTMNQSLLRAMNHSRAVENNTLKKHVEQNGEYYRSYSMEHALFSTEAAAASGDSENGSTASPMSPVSIPYTPCAIVPQTPGLYRISANDILPFLDARHRSVLHRYHEGANVIVFFMRPGPCHDSTRLLRESLVAQADMNIACGLFILGLGAGNVSDGVKECMRWARDRLFVPVVWSSQCFGSAGGHYATGLQKCDGVCVYDATFECIYTRLLCVLSSHIFLQERQQQQRKKRGNLFCRSKGFRDAVESWMAVPHRLSFTVPAPEGGGGEDTDEELIYDWGVVRDSSVSKYKA